MSIATFRVRPEVMPSMASSARDHVAFLIEDGHVWTHGLGVQKRYALQHTMRYQIWELDQPHYLHAHGRSPRGHVTDPETIEQIRLVRQEFATAARYEDD